MYAAIIKKDKKKPEMDDMFGSKKLKINKQDSEDAMKALKPEIMLEDKPVKNRKPGSVEGLEIDVMMQSSKKKSNDPYLDFNKKPAKEQRAIRQKAGPSKMKMSERFPDDTHRDLDKMLGRDKGEEYDPEIEQIKEDILEKQFKKPSTGEDDFSDEEKKKYLQALKTRMRTA